MTPTPQSSGPRRAVWRWVLLAASLCLAPFLMLGAVAVSYLTLNRDVRTLRNHVMDATDSTWHTKVQMSVGNVTLGAVRQGLRLVDGTRDVETARDALRAVRHASVGVYERASGPHVINREQLFVDTDRAMQRRGWTRLVGVANGKETVLVYVQEDASEDEPMELCVAVVNEREMVVASTTIDARALGDLVAKHSGDDVKKHLRFAKFRY